LAVGVGKVRGTEVAVVLVGAEHVVDRGEEGGRDGDDGRLLPVSTHEAVVERPGVAVANLNGAPGALDERGLEPTAAALDAAGAVAARALVEAGRGAGPGGPGGRGGETGPGRAGSRAGDPAGGEGVLGARGG